MTCVIIGQACVDCERYFALIMRIQSHEILDVKNSL
jgi:hypothetical protein